MNTMRECSQNKDTLWSLIDGGVWKIVKILIGGGAGIVGGLGNFPNINRRGGGGGGVFYKTLK